jgi:DNA-binding response OmpR family regulator
LLDINLPDGSGLDIIPKLKNHKVDFLVISAYDDKREQALRQGASGFLKKPFDLKSITSRIADIT